MIKSLPALTLVGAFLVAPHGLPGGAGAASAQGLHDYVVGLFPPSLPIRVLPPRAVVGFSTLDTDGTPVPCELTLAKVQGVLATTAPTDANRARFEELKTRGIERCAAHDDARANALLAEALGMVGR